MLGEFCWLCLDVVYLLKSKRKVLNKGLILNYLPLLVSAQLPYMSWIRILICISPYGSRSEFYYTNPDPQIRIRIRIIVSDTCHFDFGRLLAYCRSCWNIRITFADLVPVGSVWFVVCPGSGSWYLPTYFSIFPKLPNVVRSKKTDFKL